MLGALVLSFALGLSGVALIRNRASRPADRAGMVLVAGALLMAAGFMLARCSKDNYFPMIDVLFKQQANWVSVDNGKDALLQLAKLAGFSQQSFEACLTDQKLLDQIREVRVRGEGVFGVNSTPTFFINGEKYAGALSIDEMSAIIDPKL